MTIQQRIAATECVRLMILLAESTTPHSRELALVVGTRLAAVVDGDVGRALSDDAIAPWVEIGRALEAKLGSEDGKAQS